ncbi:hypothetical protein CC1G_05896 [Coprinopsis cinerea okayama7|uniref:Opi1-domain-containing protein n=1 Tax=Coprinopsis cinerea (strain Okayama-7 / 130 / ATCC MYA-4618 / FGSC 9003) TaxID=240176 RepID=A8NAE5_COPC7|nr:hypothetical protein CC1G_05896 [Coprinopsis cinerea okayama7\|eukprot:XP_001831797.1 hypothetical protein CC1G_05896 [Coprinopsis cinerea okayama7\
MSSLPLVGSALRVYEHGKASSRVVKYGAEMVESSVKTLSRPVIDRLPVNVNQLDEFACRQLDRLDRYRRPSNGDTSTVSPHALERERGRSKSRAALNGSAVDDSPSMERRSPSQSTHSSVPESSNSSVGVRLRKGWKEGGERGVPSWLEATNSYANRPADSERSATPTQNGNDASSSNHDAGISDSNDQQVAQRSRWQAVLLEAGGLSAALSEDSMRRLKYCLQWLQYATAHIDAQILILREFTASLQTYPPDAPPHARRPNPISEEHMRKLAEVRKDVVQTVRQVVDVVSKYAGGALPEPARSTVRGFILKLPQRWASKAGVPTSGNAINPLGGAGGAGERGERERETVAAAAGAGAGGATRRRRAANRERGAGAENGERELGVKSAQSSRAPSPSSPRVPRATINTSIAQLQQEGGNSSSAAGGAPNGAGGAQVSHGAAMVAAQRILSLATESLDMMRGVTGVVKDSLDRAESWVSRLRSVGIQRTGQPNDDGSVEGPSETTLSEADFEAILNNPDHPLRRGGSGGGGHHRRTSSSMSDMTPMSPFFSGASTATWGSSIPSTPGGPYGGTGSGGGGDGAFGAGGVGGHVILPPIGQMTLDSRCNTPKSVVGELPEEEDGDRRFGRSDEDEDGMRISKDDEEEDGGFGVRRGVLFGKESEMRTTAVGGGGGGGEVKVVGVDDRRGVGVDEEGQRMDVDV